jgi:hypothetical protein
MGTGKKIVTQTDMRMGTGIFFLSADMEMGTIYSTLLIPYPLPSLNFCNILSVKLGFLNNNFTLTKIKPNIKVINKCVKKNNKTACHKPK